MAKLAGRIALVTGAGAGIGLDIAKLYAAEGAHVYVNDLNPDTVGAAVKTIMDAGGKAAPAVADVTDRAAVAEMLAQINSAHGQLDILVNNAGISGRADFRSMDDETWDKVVDINLTAVMRLMRDGFPLLKASGKGVILNLSSIMATKHTRQMSNYSTTKGAVSALSRSVALEYAPFNIRVNYLCPGWIETALTKRFTGNPFIAKALLQQTPMNRFGTVEEVAKTALFLVSDDASYITGAGLNVDGGMSVSL